MIKNNADIAIEIWGIPSQDWRGMEPDLNQYIEKDYTYENSLIIAMPEFWKLKTSDHVNSLAYGIFEGTKVPMGWAEAAKNENIKAIICASNHNMEAWLKVLEDEEIINKLQVVHHGVNPDIFKPEGEKDKNFTEEKFRFLFVGGWKDGINDRKGLDLALKAFSEEFKPEENVDFVLKINDAYQSLDQFNYNINSLKLPEKRGKIQIIFGSIPEIELAKVYRSCDVFVMPSKAESFCMPVAEAMAVGLPIIATNYSGYLDYVTKDNLLVRVEKMIQATGEPWWYEQAQWALLDIEDLKKKMRYAYNHREKMKNIGMKNSENVRKNLTWEQSAKKILELAEERLNAK